MFRLEQDTLRKKRVNEKLPELEKFETRDNREYEVEAIINSAVYGHEIENQLLNVYYLILWQSYPKEEST